MTIKSKAGTKSAITDAKTVGALLAPGNHPDCEEPPLGATDHPLSEGLKVVVTTLPTVTSTTAPRPSPR